MADHYQRAAGRYYDFGYAPAQYPDAGQRPDRDIDCRPCVQILSYVAQTEREFIRKRQAEGIAAAKARGVKFGAEKKPKPEGYGQIRDAWLAGEISLRDAGEILGVSHMTFYRWCKREGL